MTTEQVRQWQKEGVVSIKCRVNGKPHSVRYVENLQGGINGNPHDLWIRTEKRTVARVYLGSRGMPEANLEALGALSCAPLKLYFEVKD